MTQQPYKLCPQCQQPAVLSAPSCGRCGQQYRTQFATPDQTQVVIPPQHPPVAPVPYQPPAQPYYPLIEQPYQPPPSVWQQPYARPAPQQSYVPWAIASGALAFFSLIFFPPFTGATAIYCGWRVKAAGNDGLGIALMVVSGCCMTVGMFVGALIGMSGFR
jgi:hypothetical protein